MLRTLVVIVVALVLIGLIARALWGLVTLAIIAFLAIYLYRLLAGGRRV